MSEERKQQLAYLSLAFAIGGHEPESLILRNTLRFAITLEKKKK